STINLIWPNGKDPHSHQLTLAAHYATRTVFSGAGQPTENGYAIAQKLQRVEYFAHPQATKKPLVDTKDEAHAGDSPLRRLQVSSGDANISPWALRMKFGTTSLVLRLLEHGVDVSDLHLKNSMFAAQRVAKDIDGLSVPFATSEKTMTALDIQEEFAHRARQLSSTIELPQEEQAVIAEWGTTVDALRRYSKTGEQQEPLRQIDWYTKKQVLDRYEERTGSATLAEKQALDLRYDQLSNGIGMRMRKERFAPHTPSEEAISNAQKNPPEGRAKLRGTLIKETTARNAFVRVGWDDARRDGYYSKKLPIDGDYGEVAIADLVTKIFGRE
ncbi:MAG TPA: proteasome accessory factor PafA2 family protein, partial [Allocoleopsis sp.]